MALESIVEGVREVGFFWSGPGPAGGPRGCRAPGAAGGFLLIVSPPSWPSPGAGGGWDSGFGGPSKEPRCGGEPRRETVLELGDPQPPGEGSSTEREKPGEGVPSGARNGGPGEGGTAGSQGKGDRLERAPQGTPKWETRVGENSGTPSTLKQIVRGENTHRTSKILGVPKQGDQRWRREGGHDPLDPKQPREERAPEHQSGETSGIFGTLGILE